MLKSEDLVLHPEFLQRLRALPQSYAYGEYRQIFQDYGTHYITEAALGGDFEYTIILDKERLEKSGDLPQSTSVPFKGVRGNVTLWSQRLELCFFPDYSLEDYKKCTQAGLKVGANIFGVYVSAGAYGGSCNGLLNEMGGEIPLQANALQLFQSQAPESVSSPTRGHGSRQHGGGLCGRGQRRNQ